MKFVDLINESFTPDEKQLKDLKKAKVIYLAYKEGAIKYERSVTYTGNHPGEDYKEEFNTIVGYKLGKPQYEWRLNFKNNREMYLLVSVKNITVYIKDPALYDALVVNPVRGSNHWNDFINGTVRPVLIKRFNAHGVKLYVNEAKIDFVFVEPKKEEQISEERTPEELKKIKNVRAIYLAHKKDTVKIRFSSPKTRESRDIVIGYKLGEPEINWNSFRNQTKEAWITTEDVTLYIKDPELYNTIINSSTLTRAIVRGYIYPKMITLLSKYNINYMPQIEPKAKFVFVEPKETKDPEQINEDPTVGEENKLSDKEMKNFKALWSSYKEGVFKYNDKKYKYQLRNEYDVFKMPTTEHASSRIVVLINGTFESSIRVYEMQDNGHHVLLDYGLENRLYSLVKAKVKRNFASHNVHLHL